MRAWTTGKQDATSARLAIECIEKFTYARLCRQRASALLIKEILKLIDNDKAWHICRISNIKGIENSKCLILWRHTGQIRCRLSNSCKDVGNKFRKESIFIDAKQD